MADETHLLFQQVGEMLSAVRGLHGTIDMRQAQAEQLYDLLRTDLSLVRHDQRQLEEKLERTSWLAQHDIEGLRMRSANSNRSVEELLASVNALKRPIAELAALKARMAALLFAAGVFGSVALWLAEPIYRWFVETAFQRH